MHEYGQSYRCFDKHWENPHRIGVVFLFSASLRRLGSAGLMIQQRLGTTFARLLLPLLAIYTYPLTFDYTFEAYGC